ncbi:MAG: dihydrolipoyl dehydrogenase [Arenicellales bacterium]|jgi:dihydrolipoamide dehydrogenase
MSSSDFDVIVIGAGPGGYVAAIRCAQLGLKTACIDRWTDNDNKPSPGGTCLNVGCIPSKALLDSSERFEQLKEHSAEHGIQTGPVEINIEQMQQRKRRIVSELTGGIGALFKANKVTSINGHGCLIAPGKVRVRASDSQGKDQVISAQHVILASGSEPTVLPGIEPNGETIFDSSGALDFDTAPSTLAIIGAGVIGLELGSVWRRLGSKVVILEALDKFLPSADPMIAREAQKQFSRQGLDIRLGCQVTQVDCTSQNCTINYRHGTDDRSVAVERLIVAVGRRPCSAGLLDPACGLQINQRGFVEVDQNCATAIDGVWAVGDLVRGPMLAHKASEEGVAVAEHIALGAGHVDFATIPWVIYTDPEIAWVGATETQLKTDAIEYRAGVFPFAATGRAKAAGMTDGFVKILAHADTDRVLGAHMIGPQVSELICEAGFAMAMEASAEDLARTVHAHPTLAEATHEAALATAGRAIHKINR